jgi:hypothetical protein
MGSSKRFYRKGGRPRKSEDDKKVPVLTLRLNKWERSRLRNVMKSEGWSGDKASFVRWYLMSQAPNDPIDREKLDKLLWAVQQVLIYGISNTSKEHRDIFEAASDMLLAFVSNMYVRNKGVKYDTSKTLAP